MARSLSNARVFCSAIARNFSIDLQRREYSAASQKVAGIVRESGRMEKTNQEEGNERSVERSWVPHPVTGYYRPANQVDEVDVAELREIFLKHKSRPQ